MPFPFSSSISLSISIEKSMNKGCPAWVTDHQVDPALAQGKRFSDLAINHCRGRSVAAVATLHKGRTALLEQKMPAFAQDAWRTRLVWQSTCTRFAC